MATINNKLIHFKSKSDFNSRYKETTDGGITYGDFLGTSIVFIQDAKQIWTHGQFYDANEATLASLGITATAQELNYCDGVTSNIQTQLNGKAALSHTHTVSQISNLGSGWNTVLTSTYAAPEVVLTPEIFKEYVDTYGYYDLPNNNNYRVLFPSDNLDVKSQAEGGNGNYRRIATKEDVDFIFKEKFTTGIDCLSSSGVWSNPTSYGTWADAYREDTGPETCTWVSRDNNGNSCFNRIGASYIYAYNGFFQQAFSSSDERLKNITAELDGYESLQNLLNLRTVRFQWKDSGEDAIGLIAQDVEKVYPELVSEHAVTGMKGISYEHLIPVLMSAIKYMQQEINDLKNEISKK